MYTHRHTDVLTYTEDKWNLSGCSTSSSMLNNWFRSQTIFPGAWVKSKNQTIQRMHVKFCIWKYLTANKCLIQNEVSLSRSFTWTGNKKLFKYETIPCFILSCTANTWSLRRNGPSVIRLYSEVYSPPSNEMSFLSKGKSFLCEQISCRRQRQCSLPLDPPLDGMPSCPIRLLCHGGWVCVPVRWTIAALSLRAGIMGPLPSLPQKKRPAAPHGRQLKERFSRAKQQQKASRGTRTFCLLSIPAKWS